MSRIRITLTPEATELFSIPAEVTVPAETEEVHRAAAAVVEVAAAVAAEINIKFKAMKRIFFYIIPVVISFLWLFIMNHTSNPFILKGPDFLKFYLILIFMFYSLILTLKYFKYKISETELYGLGLIILFGIIKLFIGIILEKPVGFLILILLLELIVFLTIKRSYFNCQLK